MAEASPFRRKRKPVFRSAPYASSERVTIASTAVKVQLITEAAEFAALKPAWTRLAERCSGASVFLSHEWFESAWQWRRQSARLYILCAFEAAELVAVLPLVSESKRWAGMTVLELSFLSVPDSQMCDLVVSDDHATAAANAIVSTLRERQMEWDVLRLDYLPQGSRTATVLQEALSAQGFSCRIEANRNNAYLSLEGTWDAFYAGTSRRLKKANNLIANRLEKAGAIRIEWLAPGTGTPEDVARVTKIVTDISARSWKKSTGNSADNPGPGAFIQRLSELAHRRGWLSVWILSLDDVPVATEYQLIADGNVFALRSDFDATAGGQTSPGSYLSRHIIENLFGRDLRRYYMGPGENKYKYRWTELADPLYRMTVYARSPRGRLLQAWERSLRPAARALRNRLRRSDSATPGSASEP